MKKLTAAATILVLTAGAVFWAFTGGFFAGDNSAFTLPNELTSPSLESPTEGIASMPALPESSQPAELAGRQRPVPTGLATDRGDRYVMGGERLSSMPGVTRVSSSAAIHPDALLSLGFDIRALTVPVLGSSYAHQGADGRFIPVAPRHIAPLTIPDWGQNRLPTLSLLPMPAQLEVVITCSTERVAHRLTLEEANAFPLLPSRTYDVRILARYDGAQYTGTVNFGYTIATNALPVRFEISGDTTDLGEALVLRARNLPCGTQVTTETSLPNAPVFFSDSRGGAVALLPVSIHVTPGDHFVELRAGGALARFPITVLATEFAVQRFNIDQSIADQTVNSAAANAEYRRVIHPLREVSDPVQHWQGRFSYPVTPGEGRITTPFAVIRFVNGVGPSRHAAIDIALPQGTPVYAPAGGRVLFAGYLQLTGNTIAIEHGLGLKTWYYHLVSLDVQTGEMVTNRQRIGAVGTTGFSTGPHLHYGMSVFGVYINPDTATNTDIFNWN